MTGSISLHQFYCIKQFASLCHMDGQLIRYSLSQSIDLLLWLCLTLARTFLFLLLYHIDHRKIHITLSLLNIVWNFYLHKVVDGLYIYLSFWSEIKSSFFFFFINRIGSFWITDVYPWLFLVLFSQTAFRASFAFAQKICYNLAHNISNILPTLSINFSFSMFVSWSLQLDSTLFSAFDNQLSTISIL